MIRSLLLLPFFAVAASAGEFNKVLTVGDAAPEWKDLPGTDGKKHSLADLKDKDAVVVVFTCNSCPFAVEYEDRIVALAKSAGEQVAVVAINVNTIKDDALPEMTKRAEKKKFPFAYLFDESQAIAKKFGANYTPEFFVLNKERKIAYMGALDDTSKPADVKARYVEDALAAARAGKPAPKGETLARGCKIRFNRAKD
jgi:peroxiredoxin